MDNLHRELAPVSDEAWSQIDEEAARTLRRHLAGRRVVDVHGPAGESFGAVPTGHLQPINPPEPGVQAHQRQVAPLVQLRVPFTLDRQQIDDVARGSQDSNWQPVKDAARQLAFAEDRAVFEGYSPGAISGIGPGSGNSPVPFPADARDYPDAVAKALSQLRVAGVNGPYAAVLSADAYTAVSETSDHGYPVIEHIGRLVSGDIVWAPAIAGGYVLTTRGGDFDLQLGQDVSIGYLGHNDADVELYLQESFTFLVYTGEAAVALTPAG
ncbi:MAG TPA: family 1 encapsulin nanocompartment shell protein [Streptosporangiaceae bacterium]|nr:family 1 encapsulin nanocompartment shell protein [Streptosporangiaceae bacterium]